MAARMLNMPMAILAADVVDDSREPNTALPTVAESTIIEIPRMVCLFWHLDAIAKCERCKIPRPFSH
jgi:hypothetical protein